MVLIITKYFHINLSKAFRITHQLQQHKSKYKPRDRKTKRRANNPETPRLAEPKHHTKKFKFNIQQTRPNELFFVFIPLRSRESHLKCKQYKCRDRS